MGDPKSGDSAGEPSPEIALESTHAAGETALHYGPGLEEAETIGRFEVREILGRGGMGVVVAAFDPELARKVAIKVLRPDAAGELATKGRARLLREAQAMAQISNPNVIAVHDVGTVGDSVYIAMELVEGDNLRQWQQGREADEIIDAYVQAGRGLAAAHAAELVHRDFKPDNVLVDRDGRVRVTDFGLASAGAESITGDADPGSSMAGELTNSSPLTAPLTHTGALVGTPAYMSPEQHLGEPADARADQFAFCVALAEALGGERPFAGRTYDDLRANVLKGRHSVAKNKKIPKRARAVLERGLANHADDRYPTMDALLADLAPRPARRLALVAAAGAAVIAAAVLVVPAVLDRGDRCDRAAADLDAIWSPAIAGRLARAFQDTGHTFAKARWERVEGVLSGYATTWRERAIGLCREPPSEVAEARRRALCRDQALATFDALVTELSSVSADRIDGLAQGLLNVKLIDCPDVTGAELTVERRALRIDLRIARVLQAVGFTDEAAARLDALEPAIESSGDDALLADFLYWRAVSQMTAGKPDLALETARRVESVAARAERKPTRVRAALLGADALMHRDLDAAEVSIERAARYLEGWKAPVRLTATLELAAGRLAFFRGDWQGALDRFKKMRDVGEGAGDELITIAANDGVGSALEKLGRLDEAVEIHDKNLANRRRVFGDSDESVAQSHNHLASALYTLGDTDKALAHMEEAHAILSAGRGEGHPTVLIIARNAAELLAASGRFDESLARADKVLAIARDVFGDSSNAAADAHQVRSIPLVFLGRLDEALAELEAALAIYRDQPNAPPPDVVACHIRLAEVLRKLERPREALEHAREAVSGTLSIDGPESARVAVPRKEEGLALLDLGKARQAAALLAAAVERASGSELRAAELAQLRFALARSLWASGGDRARARTEAMLAREGLREAGGAYEQERREIDAWLAKRESGRPQ